jgi:hypothetical protein
MPGCAKFCAIGNKKYKCKIEVEIKKKSRRGLMNSGFLAVEF